MTPAGLARKRRIMMIACIQRGENGRCACTLRCDLVVKPPLTYREAEERGFPNGGRAVFPDSGADYRKLRAWEKRVA
jgi:hypothetical protein